MSKKSPVFTLRIPTGLTEDLDRRAPYLGNRSEVVKTDLARYRALVRATQTRLAREEVFSDREQGLILDALNGSLVLDYPETLAASVEDSMVLDGTAGKWGVEAHALRAKLASLTPLEFAAVADASERFWSVPESRDVLGGLF